MRSIKLPHKKVLNITGYGATGSSALTDLLSCFSECSNPGRNSEIWYVQEPNGLLDLAIQFLERPHRINSGYYLEKFISQIEPSRKMYREIFGSDFDLQVRLLINILSHGSYKTSWHQTFIDSGDLKRFLFFRLSFKFQYYVRQFLGTEYKFGSLPYSIVKSKLHSAKFGGVCRETFCNFNNAVFADLFTNPKILVLDQLFPTYVPMSYRNVFDENFLDRTINIVVRRDPRDLYILINTNLKNMSAIPYKINDFINWYREMEVLAAKKDILDKIRGHNVIS